MNKCNFCGRPEKDAELLITGQNGYICSDCVRQCYEILKSMNLELEPEARRNKKDGQHHFNLKQVPKPTEIKQYLDEYIIGQDEAKRYLSVAV